MLGGCQTFCGPLQQDAFWQCSDDLEIKRADCSFSRKRVPRKHAENPISLEELHLKIARAQATTPSSSSGCTFMNLATQVGGIHLDNEDRVKESLSSQTE